MKRTMFLVVLAVLFVSFFGLSVKTFADGDDNLKRAGQQALAEREEVLFSKLGDIETYVQIVADDRTATKDEMVALRSKINEFNKTKIKFDRELADYGLKTETSLDEAYKLIRPYFRSNVLFKEDVRGTVRKFFALQTGKDMTIGGGAVMDDTVSQVMFFAGISFFLMVACGIVLRLWGQNDYVGPVIVIVEVSFVIFILALIFIFFV